MFHLRTFSKALTYYQLLKRNGPWLLFSGFGLTKMMAQKEPPTPFVVLEENLYHTDMGSDWERPLTTSSKVHVVLLYREGCPYCRRFLPIFQEFAQQNASTKGVHFLRVRFTDDKIERTAQKEKINKAYGIVLNTFPCLLFIKNGKLLKSLQGNEEERKPQNLARHLKEVLQSPLRGF